MLRSLCSRRFGTSAARLALYELGIDTLPGAGIASRSANFYAAEMTTILGRGRGEKSESPQFQGTFTSAFGTKAAEFIYIRKHDSYGELEKAHDTLMKAQNSLPVQVERNQEIVILNPFPWYDVKPLNGKTGIFEYRMYTLKPGVMAQWAHRFQQGFDDRRKYSEPLGMWFSEVGQLNAVHHVWHYDSLQHRIDVRNKALTSEIWRETVRDTQPFLDTMWSRILRPTKPLDIL